MRAYLQFLGSILLVWICVPILAQEKRGYLDFKSPYTGETVLRPFVREMQFGYALRQVRNDFFNSLVMFLQGPELSFKYPRFSTKNIQKHQIDLGWFSTGSSLSLYYFFGKYQYSMLFDADFLRPLQKDFHKLYLGFNAGVNANLLVASDNINNQFYPALDVQTGLSLLDIWQFKIRKKPFYVHLIADFDILGMTFFRPLYLTLAPGELVANLRKATKYLPISPLLPHNYQYLHTEAKFAYPFVSGKKRKKPHIWYLFFSYNLDFMNSKINNVQFTTLGHSFHLGLARKIYR